MDASTAGDALASGSDSTIGNDTGTSDAGAIDAAAACAQRAVSDTMGVFVTPNGNDTSTCGDRASPCLTVQVGVNQAKLLNRAIVYLARGTYTEAVTLAPGVTLEGAWDTLSATWVPICGSDAISAAKLQMPATATATVTASFAGSGGMRQVTVRGKAAAQPGESLYGVIVNGATFTLDTVVVTVGNAGDGVPGDAGAPGTTGSVNCDAGDGGTGIPAPNASAAQPGTFGPSGYVAGVGSVGASDGGNGTAGGCSLNPVCVTVCYTCTSGCPKASSGCGGSPGGGGAPGEGAGSSIAVYAWNAKLTVIGGAYTAGNGGTGGAGGPGGASGMGGGGSTSQVGCLDNCSDAGCATVGDTTIATANVGGLGGAGGSGSGGAGGSSYAIFAGGTASTVTVQNSPTLAHGQPGMGGSTNGPAGQAADRGP